MSHTVLVLGAGIGGIVAAETLRKLLPGGKWKLTGNPCSPMRW